MPRLLVIFPPSIIFPKQARFYMSILKSSLLMLGLTLLQSTLWATGITFSHGSWQEILDLAKSEQKLIFVDAYTEWCGPCKMMARNTFPDERVGEYFNQHFVNYKFDMEKGEGPAFAQKYGVNAYPTLLFIDHTGKVVHKTMGYQAPSGLLQEAQKATKPNRNENLLELQVEGGTENPEVLYQYATLLKKQEKNYSEVAARYFATQREKDLDEEQNWQAIEAFTDDLQSREFAYLLKKQKRFMRRYGVQPVADKIYTVLKRNVIKAGLTHDRDLLEEALEIARKDIKDDGQVASRLRMVYAEAAKDWKDYAFKTIYHFDNFIITSALELDNAARNFLRHVDNPDQLANAAEWCRQATAIDNSYRTNATYALVLGKLGREAEAKRQAYQALQLLPANETDQGEEIKALLRDLGEPVE
jgi:thioredoxin-related protein